MDGMNIVKQMLEHYKKSCETYVGIINEQYRYNNREKARAFRRKMFNEYLTLSDVACDFIGYDEVKATIENFRKIFEDYDKNIIKH